MEANNHFASAGQPPLSSTSGLKQLPQLVEPVYTNNSLVIFPQQVKGLNSDMPVNGLISPCIPTNPHGTFSTGASTTSYPASNNFDYLWKFPKSPLLKDCHGSGLSKVNGSTSPVSNGPLFKVTSLDAWEHSSSERLESLSFSGQDMCNFSNLSVKMAAAANGDHCYPKISSPTTGPLFNVQVVPPATDCQSEQDLETLEDVLEVSAYPGDHCYPKALNPATRPIFKVQALLPTVQCQNKQSMETSENVLMSPGDHCYPKASNPFTGPIFNAPSLPPAAQCQNKKTMETSVNVSMSPGDHCYPKASNPFTGPIFNAQSLPPAAQCQNKQNMETAENVSVSPGDHCYPKASKAVTGPKSNVQPLPPAAQWQNKQDDMETTENASEVSTSPGDHCYPKISNPFTGLIFNVHPLPPAAQCQNKQEDMETSENVAEVSLSPEVHSDPTSPASICPHELEPELVSQSLPLLSPSEGHSLDDSCKLTPNSEDSELHSSDSLESFHGECALVSPGEPACNAICDFKEQENKNPTQSYESPTLELSNLEPADNPPVTEERKTTDLDDAVSGDLTQDISETEGMKEDDAENAKSALESFSSVNVYAESVTSEPSLAAEAAEEELEPEEVKGTPGRRRVATPDDVRRPLLHGWRREVRISKGSHRWQGETWYYAPCGKRMKQFPEVIKYLSKHTGPHVRREHFSFSPRMPVGDYYEERHTSEGPHWVLLKSEEIPSRILAITGKRGRPRNLEKAKAKENKIRRGRGRPPKVKMIDLLNKADAKQLRKLENQDILSDVEKVQLSKLRKKMRRKARNQEAKQEAAIKIKLRERKDLEKEERKREQKAREAELIAEKKAKEAELLAKKKAKEAEQIVEKRKTRRRQRENPLQQSPVVQKPDRKQLAEQRRLEERKRQQFMLEELKKPTEDMCLSDHQPLPDFPCVPGLVLPNDAFFDCLMTMEFLIAYGKVFGLNEAKEIPSLYTLQEGLLNVGDSLGVVQDLLIKLLRAALFDPGLPSYCQSLKILGEKISEIILTRENVSEILRVFLEAYGGDLELCESLRTHPFQAHPPNIKAAVLGFIINELNGSTRIISEIDKTLENMSNYRKNKWIIEGKLRRLKFALSKRAGALEYQVSSSDENHKRCNTRVLEENEPVEDEPGLLTTAADDEEVSLNANIIDLERQIEKLTKRQMFLRKKIIGCSQRLRCASLGQDRYRRFYWMLPHIGGIFVGGYSEGPDQIVDPLPTELPQMAFVKNEAVDGTEDKHYFTRSRGRPRKSKTDSEHCAFCQCPGPHDVPINSLFPASPLISEQLQDGGQTTLFSWLNQYQNSFMNCTVLTPENSPPHTDLACTFEIGPCPGATDTDEKENKLYNLLPRTHSTDCSQKNTSQSNHHISPSSLAAAAPPVQVSRLSEEQHAGNGTPLPSVSALCQICNKPIRNGTTSLHTSTQERHTGRPSRKLFSTIEQKYYSQLIQRPIPEDKKQAWWWIKDPVMLEALIKALHPRGTREKALHKHLTKHLVHLKEMCSRTASDFLFGFKPPEPHPVSQETLEKWSVEQLSFQVDLCVLKRVEELEQMVMSSDLQLRGWFPPILDSVRSDLKYFEHKVDASDDILAKIKREEVRLHRDPDNPLDMAVLRLLNLEENVERRYLKEPLWILSEMQHEKIVTTDPETMNTTEIQYSITPRLRLWRQTVERCRSSAQLHLCVRQLEKSLAWERSVSIVTCIYCRKGDNDECLLLCDSCDRGCHIYCHRPPLTEIPEGDWFCRNCVSQQGESEYLKPGGSSRRAKKCVQRYEDNSPIKQSKRKEPPANSQQSPAENSLAKKRRIGTRSQSPDLTFCEIILMELESHQDAWPFLEPVNPRLVPGYRKIIKNPMDFSTMRNKLLNGG